MTTDYEALDQLRQEWVRQRHAARDGPDPAARRTARSAARRAREALDAALATTVSTLSPDLPVLLLPTRIETRYQLNNPQSPRLLIKVYPDDIHLAGHEPGLTPGEIAAGEQYWHDTWTAEDELGRRTAWTHLVAGTGSHQRAAWIAQRLHPTNNSSDPVPVFPQLEDEDRQDRRWEHGTQGQLLPDMWRATAWCGSAVASATGSLITRPLPVPPRPPRQEDNPDQPLPPDPDDTRWAFEFTAAEEAGMGLTLDLPVPPHDPADPAYLEALKVDLLIIVGIRGTSTPDADAAEVTELLTGHKYHRGLDLLPLGTATNNAVAGRSAMPTPDPADQDGFTDPLTPSGSAVPLDGDAPLLAKDLGIADAVFTDLPGSDHRSVAREGDMLTVLHPLLRYYCTQLLPLEGFELGGSQWLSWVAGTVRPSGPLPLLRVGNQPYGILPITVLDRWRPPHAQDPAAIVAAELVQGPAGLTGRLRVLGGLDSSLGWKFEQTTDLEGTPADARRVTLSVDTLARFPRIGDDPTLLLGYVTDSDEGFTCTRLRVGEGDVHEEELPLGDDTVRPFPAGALRGVALATGTLPDGIRTARALVALLQYDLDTVTDQIVMLVGAPRPGPSGRDGLVWHRNDLPSGVFPGTARITSAALVSDAGNRADLLVTTEEATATIGDPSGAWFVLRDLHADGTYTAIDGPVPIGLAVADPALEPAGITATVADVNADGAMEAILAQYATDGGDNVSADYLLAPLRDALPDHAGTRLGNLGTVLRPGTGEQLRHGAAVWVRSAPAQDTRPGLDSPRHRVNLLRELRGRFAESTPQVPQLVDGDPAWRETALAVLSTDAVSETFHAREFVGPVVLDNNRFILQQPPPTDAAARHVGEILGQLGLRLDRDSVLTLGALNATAVPITEPGPAGVGEPPDEPTKWLKEMLTATPQELHDNWYADGTPWPQRLIRHALLQAYADAGFRVVPPREPPVLKEPELVDVADLTSPDPVTPPRTPTAWRHLTDEQVDGKPLGEYLAAEAHNDGRLRELAEVLNALERLAGATPKQLGRLAGGVLDLYAYRLDAWVTAVATARLTEMRRRQPQPHGLHIAGYGLVCDLKPAGPAAEPSTGYFLAASRLHAATGTVLRDGFVNHDGDLYGVDLTPAPVRASLSLAADVAQLSSLGHALGARFEDGLVERRLQQYLPVFRQLTPLEVGALTDLDPGTSTGQAAGLVRTDGTRLLELYTTGAIPWGTAVDGLDGMDLPAPDSDDHHDVLEILDGLLTIGVATEHLARSEATMKLVQRSTESAAGTLAATNRGDVRPPEDPFVLHTPRDGTGVHHRVLLAAPDPQSTAAARALAKWPATNAQRQRHFRAAAEPRLNAWAALAFGDPAKVRFIVRRYDATTSEPTALDSQKIFTLRDVGLCPWDILAGPSPAVADISETNLGRRLLQYAQGAADRMPYQTGTICRLDIDDRLNWNDNVVSVRELLTAAEHARDLLRFGRAASGEDFAAGDDPPLATDTPEIRGRAEAAVNALRDTLDDLRGQFTLTEDQKAQLADMFPTLKDLPTLPPTLLDLPVSLPIAQARAVLLADNQSLGALANRIATALNNLAGFGIPDTAAKPRSDDRDADLAALTTQARVVSLEALRRLNTAEVNRAAAALGEADWTAVVDDVFGAGFRALPLLITLGPDESDLPDLGVHPTVDLDTVDEWIDGLADVSTGVEKLQRMSLATSVLAATPDTWQILQLPASGPRRWVGLPQAAADDPVPFGPTSLVVSSRDPGWWHHDNRVAALYIDGITETLPSPAADASVPFHFDTPNATPPQAALLAVPPDPDAAWTWDTLIEVVHEALDLAKIRMVDIDKVRGLGHVLPAIVLPHNVGCGRWEPGGDTISTTAPEQKGP